MQKVVTDSFLLLSVTPDNSFVNLANCCSKQYFAISCSGLFFWKIVVPGKLFANRGSRQRLCKFCNLLLAIIFLLILHIFVQGRGGRMVAWGDQSAHLKNVRKQS